MAERKGKIQNKLIVEKTCTENFHLRNKNTTKIAI